MSELKIVTLDAIKKNLRIESEHEDELLLSLGETAEQAVLNLVNRSLEDIVAEFVDVPAPIRQAVLMYTNHLYEHRGIVSPTALYNIPYSIDALVKHYIKLW